MTNPTQSEIFPVVAIGASEGGLDSLKQIIRTIPKKSKLAYIILCHESHEDCRNLSESLSHVAAVGVHDIVNDIHIAPDNIYIIPENNTFTIDEGNSPDEKTLKLYRRTRGDVALMPIDSFFTSVAAVYGSFTVGILLSGNGFDGSVGIKKIKEAGGATIAQNPLTALHPLMPQNAIDVGYADYILAPEVMAEALLRIRDSYEVTHAYLDDEVISKEESDIMRQIVRIVMLKTGTNFQHYRQTTLRRRIARRMVIAGLDELSGYLAFLRTDPDEQRILFDDFLIPVSYFFRDQLVFDNFANAILPPLIQNARNKTLRIWAAGCATGEEAYSIAICIQEYLAANKLNTAIQIFASDISPSCIAAARAGIYAPSDVQDISRKRLETYFNKKDGHYQVTKEIREMCKFAVHDMANDPPFAKIDMVSCRNVLIYFDQFYQHKVLTKFNYSLNSGGVLLLGQSESIAAAQILFEPAAIDGKFYHPTVAPANTPKNRADDIVSGTISRLSQKSADFKNYSRHFLAYAPAGVIVDKNCNIIHFQGDTSPFLRATDGKPNSNLTKMIRQELELHLRNAIRKTIASDAPAIEENIALERQPVRVTIEAAPTGHDGNLIIIFRKAAISTDMDSSSVADRDRLKSMEIEMKQWRNDVMKVTEEREIAYEELQTSNEELISASEELHVINKELETMTRELSSRNEELNFLNNELLARQEDLLAQRNYSDAIVNTMHEPMIVVSKDFRIQSVNPTFYSYTGAGEEETQNRPFVDLTNFQWDNNELRAMLQKVLAGNIHVNDYLVKADFPGLGKRAMLMNAKLVIGSNPPLALMTFRDITEKLAAQEMTEAKNRELEMYNEELRTFAASASHDLQEPLRKTLMFTQMVLDDGQGLSDHSRHSLNRVMVSIESMQKLINDVINYTRSNLPVPVLKKTDLLQIVKRSLEETKGMSASKNAIVNIGALPEAKVLPDQMKQLFTSLIINALAYSREGVKPEITIKSDEISPDEIEAYGRSAEEKYLKIVVHDNGQGFNKNHATRIFEPFFRLHSKDHIPGSGLGLTLCKKIMFNHKGFIVASGKVNHGCTMSIYLRA